MSKTKAAGTSRLGRDSRPKYLGVKLFAGQKAKNGSIIVRQRGSRIVAGKNVKMGKDNTLYAIKEGIVSFSTKRKKLFDGSQRIVKTVSVE
ncbi:MAG: 50S ribosomal protein L27 [Candidatus Pacebacteria bacterium]|nr:50S ribosomal protein L27 [Candidatus Paceibacterota bacterium]